MNAQHTLPQPFVSVITGSTAGIGRATALALATAGSDIILNSRHSGPKADIALAVVEAQGANAIYLPADVSDASALPDFVEQAWAWQDRVDLWVNNAGADILSGVHWNLPFESKLERLLQTDLRGTVYCGQQINDRMQTQGNGHIINIGWDQAEVGSVSSQSGQLFSLVKGGIMAYTRAFAQAAAPNVRVNCVAPGWIETLWGETVSSAFYENTRQQIPLRRWGTPQDIAHTIVWLASPAASYLTGQTIRVNGGTAS